MGTCKWIFYGGDGIGALKRFQYLVPWPGIFRDPLYTIFLCGCLLSMDYGWMVKGTGSDRIYFLPAPTAVA
jgi:hypothetical protein